MKKVLLSTSAIALVGAVAGNAHAADWDVGVGGYFEAFVNYSDVDVDNLDDTDFDGVDQKQDAEIAFTPKITLDNGLEFGANVQLEANTTSDTIDESYLFIDGSFGEILLGSENSAGYKMSYGAPDVTVVGANSGSTTAFAPISGTALGGSGTEVFTGDDFFRRTLGTTFLEVRGNNDAQRITYFTPRFAGFQLGASYARDGEQDSNAQINTDFVEDPVAPGEEGVSEVHDIFDFGANYVNSFGEFNVAISGRYGFGSVETKSAIDEDDDDDIDLDEIFGDDDDPKIWAVGANVGYAGFTVGGSYAEANDHVEQDGNAWDAGVAYETGPWGVSFTYFNGENVDNENLGADEEIDIFLGGISYTVAKGVKIGAYAGYQEFDEELSDDGTSGGDDVENWFGGVSTAISF